jgi:hypothetical protein
MNRRWLLSGAVVTAFAFGGGYMLRARAEGAPSKDALSYAGVVEDAQGPVNGAHNVQVMFYDAATSGTQLCQTPSTPVTLTNGRFNVLLPDACATAVRGNPNVWTTVLVDGSDTGRAKIGAVPYALEAAHAVSVSVTAEPLKTALAAKADVSALDTGLAAKADALQAWQNFSGSVSPQNGSVTTTRLYARYRKIGDTLEVRSSFTLTQQFSSGQMIFSIPPSFTVDFGKIGNGGLVGTLTVMKPDGGEIVMGCYAGGSANNCFATGSGLFSAIPTNSTVSMMMSAPVL